MAAAILFRASTLTPATAALVGDGAMAAESLFCFAVLVPGLFGWLVESVLPAQLGGQALPLPRLQLVTRGLYAIGAMLLVVGPFLLASGEVAGGHLYLAWQADTVNDAVLMIIGGISLATLFAVSTAANAILIFHRGMAREKHPSFLASALYARSVVVLVAAPVFLLTMVLVVGERTLGLSLFAAETGGDPTLFMHLYWFGAHPLVYSAALPALGVAVEVASGLSGRRSGRSRLTFVAVFAVGVASLFAWGQHVPGASSAFMLLCALFAVVSSALLVLLVGRVLSVLRGGRVLAAPPLLFALGATGLGMLFAWLGVASAPHGMAPWFNLGLYDTLGVDLLLALSGFAAVAASLYWMPHRTGRMADEALSRSAFVSGTLGTTLVLVGDLQATRMASGPSAATVLLAVGTVLTAVGFGLFIAARRRSHASESNPWRARGAEWGPVEPAPAE